MTTDPTYEREARAWVELQPSDLAGFTARVSHDSMAASLAALLARVAQEARQAALREAETVALTHERNCNQIGPKTTAARDWDLRSIEAGAIRRDIARLASTSVEEVKGG